MTLPINEIALILLLQSSPLAPAEYAYQDLNPSFDQQVEFAESVGQEMLVATPSFPPVPKPQPVPPPQPKPQPTPNPGPTPIDPPKIPPDDGGTDPDPDDDDDTEEDRDEDSDDDRGPGDTDAGSQPAFGRF